MAARLWRRGSGEERGVAGEAAPGGAGPGLRPGGGRRAEAAAPEMALAAAASRMAAAGPSSPPQRVRAPRGGGIPQEPPPSPSAPQAGSEGRAGRETRREVGRPRILPRGAIATNAAALRLRAGGARREGEAGAPQGRRPP